jgi:hypothetical protein
VPDIKAGEAISPPDGYVSDALDRITGGGIDPSGNVWLMNNWKKTGPYPPTDRAAGCFLRSAPANEPAERLEQPG